MSDVSESLKKKAWVFGFWRTIHFSSGLAFSGFQQRLLKFISERSAFPPPLFPLYALGFLAIMSDQLATRARGTKQYAYEFEVGVQNCFQTARCTYASWSLYNTYVLINSMLLQRV